jgi:hypothetical protein
MIHDDNRWLSCEACVERRNNEVVACDREEKGRR